MELYDELKQYIDDIKEPKKSIILDLLKDYSRISKDIETLKPLPKWVINPNDPSKHKKLEAFNMIKDLQAQKNDIATKILRSFDNDAVEESPLLKALAKFND